MKEPRLHANAGTRCEKRCGANEQSQELRAPQSEAACLFLRPLGVRRLDSHVRRVRVRVPVRVCVSVC